jgi:hypothetical protein
MCLGKMLLFSILGFMDGLHEHGLARINSINKQIIMKIFITIKLETKSMSTTLYDKSKVSGILSKSLLSLGNPKKCMQYTLNFG